MTGSVSSRNHGLKLQAGPRRAGAVVATSVCGLESHLQKCITVAGTKVLGGDVDSEDKAMDGLFAGILELCTSFQFARITSEDMYGLDDAILAAIGEITFCFSELESNLAYHTWLLIDPQRPRTGVVITAGMDFKKVLDTFAALVLDRTDPDDSSSECQQIRERLKVLLSTIDGVREERNRIAHSRWSTTSICEKVVGDDPSSVILRVKQSKDQRKGWQMQFEAWKLDRFQTILKNIQTAQDELSAFAEFSRKLKGLFPVVDDVTSLGS